MIGLNLDIAQASDRTQLGYIAQARLNIGFSTDVSVPKCKAAFGFLLRFLLWLLLVCLAAKSVKEFTDRDGDRFWGRELRDC